MIICLMIVVSVSGCQKKIENPLETPLPKQDENWQASIQQSYDMLTAEQQQLLNEYMLRKHLTPEEFNHTGKKTDKKDVDQNQNKFNQETQTISIAEAISAQKDFAKTHLNYRYYPNLGSIIILPTYSFFAVHETADTTKEADYFVENHSLLIALENNGAKDIGTMMGTVNVYSVANDVQQTLSIPWTQYLPPLPSGKKGMVNIELPLQMDDTNKMNKLLTAEDLQVVPDAITVYRADGTVVNLGNGSLNKDVNVQTMVQDTHVDHVQVDTNTTNDINIDSVNSQNQHPNENIVYDKIILQ